MLMYDNGEKVCLACERQRQKERKKTPSNTHKHERSCAYTDAYPHARARAYWEGRRTPFHQSNFGGDEMGDELRREGWG